MLPKMRPMDEPERMPERLYHYTSVEALAMILSERKLKFNRLDLVNDPEEAATTDLPIARELVFATCWTAEEEESLPLWKMYTPAKRGVRISLPWDFLDYERFHETKDLQNYMFALNEFYLVERDSGASTRTRIANGPYRVQYTKNEGEHLSSCVNMAYDMTVYNLYELGTKKKRHWEFEQEWRYKILGVQGAAILTPDDENRGHIEEMFDHGNHVKTERLLVSLREEALQQMQVMIGPSADLGIEVIVKALLAAHKVDAEITYSNISINW